MLLTNPGADDRLRVLERVAAEEGYDEGDELHVRLIAERARAGLIPDRHASMSAGLGYLPAQLAGLGDTWSAYHPQVRSASYLYDVAPWTCVVWIVELCQDLYPTLFDYFSSLGVHLAGARHTAGEIERALQHAVSILAWANGEADRPPRFRGTSGANYDLVIERLDQAIRTRKTVTRAQRIFQAYRAWIDTYTTYQLTQIDTHRLPRVRTTSLTNDFREGAISRAMEVLARLLVEVPRPLALQNPAPGYQSYAWTTQDWRAVKVSGDELSYDRKCGAEGTRTPSGKPRLCLPRAVIQQLLRSREGRKILKDQAMKKLRAPKGSRVPWHPRIRELHARLEERTVKDDPRQRRNPYPGWPVS